MASVKVSLLGDERSLVRSFKRSTKAAEQFNRSMVSTGKGTGRVRSALRSFGPALGVGGVAAGFVGAVKAAGSFDRAMRNVNTNAKLSEPALAKLSRNVLALAGKTAQAPETLAKGLYDITSSGFSASDSLKILRVSSTAATAGLTDTATSSKAIVAGLNAYHLSADDAGKVSDVLFTTVQKGVLSFEELAQNMGDLVPAAAPLGVRLEEVGAAIATVTLQGVPAAEAATRVKNTMLQLAKPSANLKKLFKEQGFESGEAAVKALGFSGVLELIQKKTKGNVTATAALTPEIRALLGVVGITGKNLATYRSNLAAMENAQKGAGATAGAFAEQSKSAGVKFQKLGAQLKVLQVQIGNALLPSVLKATGAMSTWLGKTQNTQRVMSTLKQVIGGIAAILGVLRAAFQGLNAVTGSTKNTVKLLVGAFIVFKTLKMAAAVGRIASSMGLANTKALAFRGSLLRLAARAAVPIAVVVTAKFLADKAGVNSDFSPKRFIDEGLRGANPFDARNRGPLLKKLLGDGKKKIFKGGGSLGGLDAFLARAKPKKPKPIFGKVSNVDTKEADAALAKQAVEFKKVEKKAKVNFEQRNQFFDALIGRRLNRVQDISGTSGQLAELKKIAGQIKARIAATKDITRKLTLEDQLLDITRQEKGLRADQAAARQQAKQEAAAKKKEAAEKRIALAEKRRAALTAKQFFTLGLDATGGERVPFKKTLARQLGSVSEAVKGTFLDTPKTRSLLARIRKVLKQGIVPTDVRAKVKEMLDGVSDELKNHDVGKQTKFRAVDTDKVLTGLGLSPKQLKIARARLSRVGAGNVAGGRGAFGVAVGQSNTVIHVDGRRDDAETVARKVSEAQRKHAKRNTVQRRGR